VLCELNNAVAMIETDISRFAYHRRVQKGLRNIFGAYMDALLNTIVTNRGDNDDG
jgi:hypothetical protein